MSKRRPEGFKNPYDSWEYPEGDPMRLMGNPYSIVFEAGADTMLEGLLEEGVYDIIKFTDEDVVIKLKTIVERTYKRGTWVFIPEDENE